MSDVAVRPATAGDGREMARVWLAVARYYAELEPEILRIPEEDGLAQAFETAIRTRTDDELQVVAATQDRLVGMAESHVAGVEPAVTELDRPVVGRHVVVDTLAVDPTSWREGVGTKLVEAVEAWARERGAELRRLDTFAETALSVPFYERQGYQRRSVVPGREG